MEYNDYGKIILTDDLFLGSGAHKRCYIHPQNVQLVIKVLYKENDIDMIRELRYRKLLDKKNINSTILPKYHGVIRTSLGKGYVFERILDFDGKESPSLRKFLSTLLNINNGPELAERLLLEFQKVFYSEKIISSDMDLCNFLVQRTSPNKYAIKMIDNIGSPVLIPLEYYFEYFKTKKTIRAWFRLLKRIKKEMPTLITPRLMQKTKNTNILCEVKL